MRGFEHIVSLFFNDVSKIPIVHQMISAHKMIYTIFGSGIYHKPHSIFKSKYQEFYNKNIGLLSVNETRMSGYFMGMHRDLSMRKVLQSTISSAKFIVIPSNNKFDKVVKYIHDNKSWERCYVLLKILSPCPIVICLADSNHAGTGKFYYYSRMTKQCIKKKSLILIIRNYSQTYHHQAIYGTCMMTKVMKKSHHQMVTQKFQTTYVLSY